MTRLPPRAARCHVWLRVAAPLVVAFSVSTACSQVPEGTSLPTVGGTVELPQTSTRGAGTFRLTDAAEPCIPDGGTCLVVDSEARRFDTGRIDGPMSLGGPVVPGSVSIRSAWSGRQRPGGSASGAASAQREIVATDIDFNRFAWDTRASGRIPLDYATGAFVDPTNGLAGPASVRTTVSYRVATSRRRLERVDDAGRLARDGRIIDPAWFGARRRDVALQDPEIAALVQATLETTPDGVRAAAQLMQRTDYDAHLALTRAALLAGRRAAATGDSAFVAISDYVSSGTVFLPSNVYLLGQGLAPYGPTTHDGVPVRNRHGGRDPVLRGRLEWMVGAHGIGKYNASVIGAIGRGRPAVLLWQHGERMVACAAGATACGILGVEIDGRQRENRHVTVLQQFHRLDPRVFSQDKPSDNGMSEGHDKRFLDATGQRRRVTLRDYWGHDMHSNGALGGGYAEWDILRFAGGDFVHNRPIYGAGTTCDLPARDVTFYGYAFGAHASNYVSCYDGLTLTHLTPTPYRDEQAPLEHRYARGGQNPRYYASDALDWGAISPGDRGVVYRNVWIDLRGFGGTHGFHFRPFTGEGPMRLERAVILPDTVRRKYGSYLIVEPEATVRLRDVAVVALGDNTWRLATGVALPGEVRIIQAEREGVPSTLDDVWPR